MTDQTPVPSREPDDREPVGVGVTGPSDDPAGHRSRPAPLAPRPAQRRSMRGSVKSMIISMIVIIAAVLVWVAMVPRVSSVTPPAVDVAGIARAHSQALKWDLAFAQGMPGFTPTNVHLLRPAHQPITWQAGYTGPDQAYAAVLQTRGGTSSWVATQISNGTTDGTVTIGGALWTKYQQSSNHTRSLVRGMPLEGLTTVVTGTANWSQLTTFAKDLVPYSRSAAAKRGPDATP